MDFLHPVMQTAIAGFAPFIQRAESGPAFLDRTSSDSDACRLAVAQGEMECDFYKACKKADANALMDWAPMVTDWDAVKRAPVDASAPLPQRQQTLAEVMYESLDVQNGPSITELMQVVLNAAKGHPAAQDQARKLLDRMGTSYANEYARVDA